MKFDWAVKKLEQRNLVKEAREASEHEGRASMGRSEETWNATLFDMLADRIEELESESKEFKIGNDVKILAGVYTGATGTIHLFANCQENSVGIKVKGAVMQSLAWLRPNEIEKVSGDDG